MGALAVGLAISATVLLAIAIGGGIAAYYVYEYPIDQANGFVDLAAADNNMTEVLNDLNTTLQILTPYHGNPNLLFPTGHTNFDLIKEQIEATIQSGIVVSHQSPDNFSYQQALKNIQSDLTSTVEGELSDTGTANWYWHFGVFEWAIVPGFFICLVGAFLTKD